MRTRIWLAAVLMSAVTPLAGGEVLKVRLSPAAAAAPATVLVQISVEPHADNRSLEVVVDSDHYYRSSQVSLDGDDARRTHAFEFRNLPSGSYEVSAVLLTLGGKPRASADARIVVF